MTAGEDRGSVFTLRRLRRDVLTFGPVATPVVVAMAAPLPVATRSSRRLAQPAGRGTAHFM